MRCLTIYAHCCFALHLLHLTSAAVCAQAQASCQTYRGPTGCCLGGWFGRVAHQQAASAQIVFKLLINVRYVSKLQVCVPRRRQCFRIPGQRTCGSRTTTWRAVHHHRRTSTCCSIVELTISPKLLSCNPGAGIGQQYTFTFIQLTSIISFVQAVAYERPALSKAYLFPTGMPLCHENTQPVSPRPYSSVGSTVFQGWAVALHFTRLSHPLCANSSR